MSIVNNIFLSIGGKSIETIIGLISFVVLARLIDPKDYGLFSIVLATYGLISAFTNVGLDSAYIKAKNVSEDLKNSFFTINVILGLLSVTAMIIAAPFLSRVYNDSKLTYLIIVFTSSMLLLSISRQGVAQLTREKNFKKLVRISLSATTVGAVLAITSAYYNYGVWAFNIRALSYAFIYSSLIFYYVGTNYKIVGINVIKSFSKEIKFTIKVLIGRQLNGIFNSADKYFIGYIAGLGSLGQYKKSQDLSIMTDIQIRMPMGEVVYPYLERSSNEGKVVLYYKYAIVLMILAMMVNGILFLEGDVILIYLLGEQWFEASQFIKYFAFFSTGLVFKGICTTISLSEDRMNKQNILTTISILVLFFDILVYYIFNFPILVFVQLFSGSIFLLWTVYLSILLYSYSRRNSFLKYLLISISILVICETSRQFIMLELYNNFIITPLIFEVLMTLLLLFYLKYGIKKIN